MSFFREHDPSLDEEEDHRTDFELWFEAWKWTPNAITIYLALFIAGCASDFLRVVWEVYVAGAAILFIVISASIQALTGTG